MPGEHEPTAPAFDEASYAWDVWQYWTASDDVGRFHESYVGHYANRAAFGEELLHNLGVDSRLQRLPDWLRAYVRFDGEAVVADFERAGHFYIYDAPFDHGTFVFDTYNASETA
jgi:antirestriction protein